MSSVRGSQVAALPRFSRILSYTRGERRSLAAVFALAGGVAVATAAQPWPTKLLVDFALGDATLPNWLETLGSSPLLLVACAALASLLVFAVNVGLDLGLRRVWSSLGQRMIYALAADLFGRVLRLTLSEHRRRRLGDLLARITTDAWCAQGVAENALLLPIQQLLTLLTVSAAAFALDPGLTSIALLVAPLLGVSAAVFGRSLKRRARAERDARSRLLSFVRETLDAIPIVQAFGAETRNRTRFGEMAEETIEISQRSNVLTTSYALVNGLCTTLGTAIVLYLGSLRVLDASLSIGSLLVFLAYLASLQRCFRILVECYGRLRAIEASVDRTCEILELEPESRKAERGRRPRRAARAGSHVAWEAVDFGYEPSRPVLSDVCLEARPGEMLALVGASGAGKTTMLSLVPRLFDPWQGRVTIDGEDVRHLDLRGLREKVAFVLQEPFLMSGSVAENIAYGRPNATRKEIEEAARTANADAFVRAMPDGYDTHVGQRGAMLSGGEQQRIAIARALLVDAPVLLLDEPTSALDARTEHLLLQALERLEEGRTTLCIAHRLSTVERADRIAVIDAGRVQEVGTHSDLLAAGGYYARLHALGTSHQRRAAP
jgi:ATP-binding cassette subfamily B protein/subfamily B ATP-binding cassette protein MsbA